MDVVVIALHNYAVVIVVVVVVVDVDVIVVALYKNAVMIVVGSSGNPGLSDRPTVSVNMVVVAVHDDLLVIVVIIIVVVMPLVEVRGHAIPAAHPKPLHARNGVDRVPNRSL